jgi:hydroxyacylglutathione hydrolase
MLTLHPIPAFTDNYIWALHDGSHCLIVDPGDAAPVQAWLADQDLALSAILITHHHPDHVGGLGTLQADWPDVPVHGPAAERIAGLSHRLEDGDVVHIDALGLDFDVITVPGHTLGHIAFFSAQTDSPILFCGDTLFAAGCGRLFEGTPAQMLASLDRLAALPDDTRVCCAHEYTLANLRFALAVTPDDPAVNQRYQSAVKTRDAGQPTLPSTVAEERRSNPFMRIDDASLVDALLAHQQGLARDDRSALFACLRQWKDSF